MNDRRAHFLTMVGDACLAASLAGLTIEVSTIDGDTIVGVPATTPASVRGEMVNETGYADPLVIGTRGVHLEDVIEFGVRSP
jgi:hypothetical protein